MQNNEAEKGMTSVCANRPEAQTIVLFAASFVGTAIEQYDFLLYGTMAAIVFNRLFFPALDPLVGTLAAFGTFAVGFFSRPVGGVIWGYFGDRIGRKPILLATLIVMGSSTVLIGCLPTYATIGIWAPVAVTVLRFIQGLAFGGEQAGAILIAVENAPADRRGFFGSWAQMGSFAGLLLSSGVVAIVLLLPEAEFDRWGWRVPFLLSILLVSLGMYIRVRLPESHVFSAFRRSGDGQEGPLRSVLTQHRRHLLIALGARVGEIAFAFFVMTFTVSYAMERAGVARSFALNVLTAAAAVGLVATPMFGILSDVVGRRPLYLFGSVLAALATYPILLSLELGEPYLIATAVIIALGVIHPIMYGPQAAFFAELFMTSGRYLGVSIAQQFAGAIGGGLTPVVATALLVWSGGHLLIVGGYIIAVLLVTVVAVTYSEESVGRAMSSREK